MANDICNSHVNSSKTEEFVRTSFRRPPFPPLIDPSEIAKKRISKQKDPKRINSRGPNCFMIYRLYCTLTNKISRSRKRERIHMTMLSTMIAEFWNSEPQEVKDHYRVLAALTEIELCKLRRCHEIYVLPCEKPGQKHQDPDENFGKRDDGRIHKNQALELTLGENSSEDEIWIPVNYEPIVMTRCKDHDLLYCPCHDNHI
ncbi:14615_t:CDS:1 [Acaulospora morrowiae]|uniref:14615_t:CDS:1 n=1 Tax=Acaulospora morrowiae TaxID=94023 RepID=A0A9N9FLR7_9GLOM|nr:14615_t:CDS:1 [Acaulospora morrowiae]